MPETGRGDNERRRPYRITGTGRVALQGAVREMRALANKGTDAARHRRRRARDSASTGGGSARQRDGRIPYERLLRWYPPQWQERYGDEMTALLHDRYANAGRHAPAGPLGPRKQFQRGGACSGDRSDRILHENADRAPAEQVRCWCSAGGRCSSSPWPSSARPPTTGSPEPRARAAGSPVSGIDALTVDGGHGVRSRLGPGRTVRTARLRAPNSERHGWSSVRGPVSPAPWSRPRRGPDPLRGSGGLGPPLEPPAITTGASSSTGDPVRRRQPGGRRRHRDVSHGCGHRRGPPDRPPRPPRCVRWASWRCGL